MSAINNVKAYIRKKHIGIQAEYDQGLATGRDFVMKIGPFAALDLYEQICKAQGEGDMNEMDQKTLGRSIAATFARIGFLAVMQQVGESCMEAELEKMPAEAIALLDQIIGSMKDT